MTSDPSRWLWAGLAILAWLILVAAQVWRARRASRHAAARRQALSAGDDAVLIAHAGQTGTAEALAWMTAETLARAGTPARVEALAALTPRTLVEAGRVLVIASTTGEGDAPDALAGFVARHMAAPAELAGVRYGLLALGDRGYERFCGFGRTLDDWMGRSGAAALFDRIEVDDGDPGAIRHWQHQLGTLTGHAIEADWSPPSLDPWRLVDRRHLNPGSPGGEIHWLAFQPERPGADWSAGDIAEIGLPHAPGISRDYSIASLPDEGRLGLIVRRMRRPDGTPGLASGWLTGDLAVGDSLGLRVRRNAAFHPPSPECPLILIGNGTGLAGLRAHWRARAGSGHGGTWLMFGERTAAHDRLLDEDLQAALRAGLLTRLDRTFSRDPDDGRYVQALIDEHGADLRDWIGRGGVILVCGALEGMAAGVDEALARQLGEPLLLTLKETGRYRRDVY
ncbi:oxidoreductase [Brevundimonas sp. LM2]|uniref:sulfite reductase subunit alpha n=1 Tax=Brevundimonas sp. LM2 TaxID=1938605 RepID=UPI000983D56B|nr:sulfite reductase subunit alpha [Brevundimonas sp. LM2]AQR60404.1 oxidoreductase [Brevundimonas sp. LM2]